MTEEKEFFDNSIKIDFSEEALDERIRLSKDRIREFDPETSSELFRACLSLTDSPFEQKIRTACVFEDPVLSAFFAEMKNYRKLLAGGRKRELAALLETLIQIELALSNGEKDSVKDIVFSYIYDYTDEFTDAFFRCGEGDPDKKVIHLTDAITGKGILSGYEDLLQPFFGSRLKARRLDALKKAVIRYGHTEDDHEAVFVKEPEAYTVHQKNLLKTFMDETGRI